MFIIFIVIFVIFVDTVLTSRPKTRVETVIDTSLDPKIKESCGLKLFGPETYSLVDSKEV